MDQIISRSSFGRLRSRHGAVTSAWNLKRKSACFDTSQRCRARTSLLTEYLGGGRMPYLPVINVGAGGTID